MVRMGLVIAVADRVVILKPPEVSRIIELISITVAIFNEYCSGFLILRSLLNLNNLRLL